MAGGALGPLRPVGLLDRLRPAEARHRAGQDRRAVARLDTDLRAAGIGAEDAAGLADTVINTLEGAELSAQVARSEEPLHLAGRHLSRLISTYA